MVPTHQLATNSGLFHAIAQVDKDAVLICYGKSVRIVTLEGNPRHCKKLVSQLEFEFPIESIGESPFALDNFYLVVKTETYFRIGICSLFT